MSINRIKITEKINSATIYLNTLEKIKKMLIHDFESDFESQLIAERIFEVISKIILDICTHIVANTINKSPNSYSDCIKTLVEMKILKDSEEITYSNLIKMRNVIVHQYSDIDLNKVFRAINSLVDDFKRFKQQILEWLESNEK